MKEYYLKAKMTWDNLSHNEQKALSLGGIAVLIFIIYSFIYAPFVNSVERMRNQIISNEKTLIVMQELDQKIASLSKNNESTTLNNSPVLTIANIKKEMMNLGLEKGLSQLKQSSNDSVEVNFKNVSFDQFLKFLFKMTTAYKLSVNQLSIVRTPKIGKVNINLMLKL